MCKIRFFLLLALIFVSGIAKADYSDFFTVSYEGREVKSGDVVIVTDGGDYEGFCAYMPHFTVVNARDSETLLYGGMYYIGQPSRDMVADDPEFWGRQQFCMSACFAGGEGDVVGEGVEMLDRKLICFPEVMLCSEDAVSRYSMKLCVCFGTIENYFPIEDSLFEITVLFTQHPDEGDVDGIAADDAATEYFSLQGYRLSAPGNGICVARRNGKTTLIRKN